MSIKVQKCLEMVKHLITYRYGEKLCGLRDVFDNNLNLLPICTVAQLTTEEKEELTRELLKLDPGSLVFGEVHS